MDTVDDDDNDYEMNAGTFEDWLDNELDDMKISITLRDLVLREENMSMKNKNDRMIRREEAEFASEEAYYNEGSWVVDRWIRVDKPVRRVQHVCGGDKLGLQAGYELYRGSHSPGKESSNNDKDIRKRKRGGDPTVRDDGPSTSEVGLEQRRTMTRRRRLGRGWMTSPGLGTAIRSLPGWKSSQECDDGGVLGPGSTPEHLDSHERDQGHDGDSNQQREGQGYDGGDDLQRDG